MRVPRSKPFPFAALVSLALTALLGLASAGCGPRTWTPTELEALRESIEAYRLYEEGEYARVLAKTDPSELEDWEFNEMRHSTLLLRGFCLEQEGNAAEALEIYEQLVREAPLSFAADDARERLRILEIERKDPEQARWMRAIVERGSVESTRRTPVEREPARFPPLPRTAGIEGYAVVEFAVTTAGRTADPVIADAQPPLLFDGTALRAVRDWTFTRDPGADPDHRQIIRIVFTRQTIPPGQEEEVLRRQQDTGS
jgi:TonB family protein